jgi:hypothetical protein
MHQEGRRWGKLKQKESLGDTPLSVPREFSTFITSPPSGQWDEAIALLTDLFLPEIFVPPSRNDWHRLHRFLEVHLAKKELQRESAATGRRRVSLSLSFSHLLQDSK